MICNKIVKRRTTCQKCGKLTEDYVNGDGKSRPWGEYFCKKCDSEEKQVKRRKTTSKRIRR